jgi:hypothetical protein
MRIAVVALGAIVLIGALIGFVRSLWRRPSGEGDRGYGFDATTATGAWPEHDGHGGTDSGGHSGA